MQAIRNKIKIWLNDKRVPDVKDKLEGLAFSVLVELDGCGETPGYLITPAGDPDIEIGGGLHEDFCIKIQEKLS